MNTPILIQRGVVKPGIAASRGYGYPTANVPLTNPCVPGTYAGYVRIAGGEEQYPAAVYVAEQLVLEAHLLDFTGDLYGKTIEVRVLAQVRAFEPLEAMSVLERQMFIDEAVVAVRQYFETLHP